MLTEAYFLVLWVFDTSLQISELPVLANYNYITQYISMFWRHAIKMIFWTWNMIYLQTNTMFCFFIFHHYDIEESDDDYESPNTDDGGGSDYESPTDGPEDQEHADSDYEPPPSEKHEAVHPICAAKPIPDSEYIGAYHIFHSCLLTKSLGIN